MSVQTVFPVTFDYVDSTMYVDVTDIAWMIVQESGVPGLWSLQIYTSAGAAGLDQRFATRAEALAEADVWVQRIEDVH
jgi:hypothetical protein